MIEEPYRWVFRGEGDVLLRSLRISPFWFVVCFCITEVFAWSLSLKLHDISPVCQSSVIINISPDWVRTNPKNLTREQDYWLKALKTVLSADKSGSWSIRQIQNLPNTKFPSNIDDAVLLTREWISYRWNRNQYPERYELTMNGATPLVVKIRILNALREMERQADKILYGPEYNRSSGIVSDVIPASAFTTIGAPSKSKEILLFHQGLTHMVVLALTLLFCAVLERLRQPEVTNHSPAIA